MKDEEIRRADRTASAAGEDVDERVARHQIRLRSRHGDKIGECVLIETVQCHWGGTLVGVTELGGGAALAHLHPCYWLSNTEGPEVGDASARPKKVRSTPEHPADVYLTAAVIVTLAETAWQRVLS